MSVADAKKCIQKMSSDSAFRESLEKADDAGRSKIVKDAGFQFTKAEMESLVVGDGELSDADLESVAGGGSAGTSAKVSAAVSIVAVAAAG